MNTNTEHQPTIEASSSQSFGKSLLLILGILVIVGTGFFWWQKHSLQSDIDTLKESIAKREERILALSGGEGASNHKNAAEILKKAQERRIEWSKIMADIFLLEGESIRFLNIGIGENNQISISGEADGMSNFLTMINFLKENPLTEDTFVQSFTKSANQRPPGSSLGELVSFSLRFTLIPSAPL